MKKILGFCLATACWATALFCGTSSKEEVQLSPLFPPAIKLHPHYIDRWTAPMISIKKAVGRHVSSLNWSGYAVASSFSHPEEGAISRVSGQWKIPQLHRSHSKSTHSAIWVGMDGFDNETVEQIGTTQYFENGKQHNYAWIEIYPSWPYEITSMPIHTDDTFTASVHSTPGSNVFDFTLENKTHHKKVTFSSQYPEGKKQSAEWIVEALSLDNTDDVLPLAKFDTIKMSHCYATVKGKKGSISGSKREYVDITMRSTSHVQKASPSPLKEEGTQFSVIWKHE